MIFYCDLQGNLKAFQNETVYQGSNNVTTIYVVAPFSRPVGLNISFTKPNKLVTSPAIMKWVGTLGNVKIPVSFVNIPEQFTDTYNVWAYALPYSITEQNGVVGVSVNAVIADSVDASGQQAYKGNLTTFTGQFTVAYSALPSPPTDIPTEWTQDKVLDLLNNYYNDAIQKIGEMNTLKTNAKDTLVKAINEVDAHADANKSAIGNLSTLTTDEKTTIVGAINEVDEHANTAQQTADNATELANTGISKAEQAQATANNAVATANEAKTTAQTAETNANSAVDTANAANATADEAKAIAQGSQRAIGFATLQAAITALNGYSNTQLKVGDNVYIVETGVPDLWVAAVEQNSVAYNYTTNDAFNDDLVENTLVQVGYYKFAYLESDGKPCTVAWQNMTVAESDWVASTEFEDFPYEAKIALSDFVNFSSIPQVVFGLTEATSGNYAPICKAGDKGVYIYSKVNTAITLPTVVTFAPNVHGASMQGGGYTNKGKWVASTTYAIDDLVYTDNGQFVCIEGITSTTSPEQDTQHWQATFVATGKTKNTLKISGQDNGTQVQKTFDGSTAVEIAFDENTMTAKEVNGVLKVGAKGTIPEALPQEASALKSGNLPTSGWTATGVRAFWQGSVDCPSDKYVFIGTSKALADILYADDSAYMIVDYNFFDGGDYKNKENANFSYKNSNATVSGLTGISFRAGYNEYDSTIFISRDGKMYGKGAWIPSGRYAVTYTRIGASTVSQQTYTISDTSITANSDVLMELTDEGGVKAYSMEAGSITVIRDTVPTQPIPCTYKVKQTNASGQFTLVNHYVPKVEIPTIPTKTSELINDSGYVSNLPTVRNVVCNDVDSAATLDTTITCEVGDLILAQIIVRSALTLPTDWTLLRTIPAVDPPTNQTLSFAYKRATSTSETLTVTQATAGRIYTNLVRLSNATSISYIQSCEKTGTSIKSISSTKPVTSNMVIWGAASSTWNTNSPSGDWTYSPSTLDYYSVPQATRQPRLGTFVDSSGAGERTFTGTIDSSTSMMCGAVEIVGDEVARKGDIPTSLPVTYKKASGNLPTSGWNEIIVQNLLTKNISVIEITKLTETNKIYSQTIDAKYYGVLQGWKIKLLEDNKVYDAVTAMVTVGNEQYMEISYKAVTGFKFNIYLDKQGNIFYADHGSGGSTYTFSGLSNSTVALHTYTISDTSITANTSVKMYLTDEGGVKAQSKASGSITVIRDEVPTSAIPYEYEVEQTSAEGLFEVINAYVPAVPTKTSQLTNDSGFAKTTETNTWTGVQTFSNADGIKTDRVHNLDNNDAWYNFDGSNNRFGSPSRPTIIRTSEARPRAQVPSGETTVTKEIALLEDIPSAATTWGSGAAGNLVIYGKGAGVYQIKAEIEGSPVCFAYWDGTSDTGYCSDYVSMSLDTDGFWLFYYDFYIEAKQIKCKHYAYKINGGTVTKEVDQTFTSFTYRKITN